MRRFVVAVALIATLAAVTATASASAPAHQKPQVCGTLPSDASGAYYYVRVWNIDCDRASEVAGNAFDHFCDENECFSDPAGGYVKGRVSFRGWDCKVKLAYEFARAVCEKPGVRFVSETAA